MDLPTFSSSDPDDVSSNSVSPELSTPPSYNHESPLHLPERSSNVHVRRLFNTEELSCDRMSTSNVLEQKNSLSIPMKSHTLPPIRLLMDRRMDYNLQELRQANTRHTDVTNRLDMVKRQLKG